MPLSPKKYFQGEFFFVVYFSSLKPSVVFFLPTEYGITDESYADGRILLGI
jgi:hypothetical protein